MSNSVSDFYSPTLFIIEPVAAKYYLNGEEVNPKKINGKSGDVKIVIVLLMKVMIKVVKCILLL